MINKLELNIEIIIKEYGNYVFKIVDNTIIRIYEQGTTTQKVSKELMMNDVEISSISQHTQNLEDYFLKLTGEVGKSC